jgi:predicted esterase
MSAGRETRRIEVPRTARYHVLGGGGATLREAWFVLHGYGQLAAPFLTSFEPLASSERRLVAPEALSRFYLKRGTGEIGASWMTREAREDDIADLVRYLDLLAERELAGRAVAVHALGFSQGAPAAARWAVLGKTRVARVTLWSGTFPPDIDLERHAERLRSIRWTFVHGKRDEAVDGAVVERDVERLRARGLAVDLVWFDGGHELDRPALEGLRQE